MVIVPAQWTEKLYLPSRGQDHLGLGSVSSDQILPKLSPGIVVQTVHPRYWSFYAFLLDEFWRRDLPRTRRDFSRFYRPREAIFAVGAHLCDRPEHPRDGQMQAIVGAIKAGALARQGPPVYDARFNYIKDALGGYGLYYSASMAAMGLTLPAMPAVGLPYDTPTPEGRILASAFRDAISDTTYYREYIDDDAAQVPGEVVLEYIRAACLCQLQTDHAPDKLLLRDVFLHAGSAGESAQRRATMRFLLDLAHQTSGHALTEDRFRQLVYYQADTDGATWTPLDSNVRTARRWRLYQAREYYSFALNRLWRYLAEWGQKCIAADGDAVPLADWWAHVDQALDFAPLAALFASDTPGLDLTSTLTELADWATKAAHAGGDLDSAWDVGAAVTEHALYRWAARNDEPAVIPAALTMLALIAVRIGAPVVQAAHTEDWDICIDGGVSRLALNRFFSQWRRHSMAGLTLGEAARWLISDYIIRQHERIAVAKLAQTGDTFRFRRQGDQLRFYEVEAPARMTNSRFQALATTIHELGFVESLYTENHTLSPDGQRLVDDGDVPEEPLRSLAAHSPADEH
jgi:hypothetical protein